MSMNPPSPDGYYAQYICFVLQQENYRYPKVPAVLQPFLTRNGVIELNQDELTPALVDAVGQLVRSEKVMNLYLTPFLPEPPSYSNSPQHRLASQFIQAPYTHGCGAVIFDRERTDVFFRRLDQYILNRPAHRKAENEPLAYPPVVFDSPEDAVQAIVRLIRTGSLEEGAVPPPAPSETRQGVDPALLFWLENTLGRPVQSPEDLEQVQGLNASYFVRSWPHFPDWLAPQPGCWSLLGQLPNLKSLFFPKLTLENWSFLRRCSRLERLGLSETTMFDSSALENLPELTYLDLPASEFANFSFLLGCPKLEILDLSRTNFRDCALLTKLPNLKLVRLPAPRQLVNAHLLDPLPIQVKTDPKRIRGGDIPAYEVIEPRPVEPWEFAPPFKVLHIEGGPGEESCEGLDITRDYIKKLCKQVKTGQSCDIYLSLNPYGEEEWMEVVVEDGWASLGFEDMDNHVWYTIYNPEHAGDMEDAPPQAGGQSPIPKMHAIQDLELAADCAAWFIQTGQLYPGAYWAKYYG